MARYAFACELGGLITIEGWAEYTVNWDDDEAQHIEIDKVEIPLTHARHKQIERGAGIVHNIPHSAVWHEIYNCIEGYLTVHMFDELVELVVEQGDAPADQQFGVGA